MKNTLVLIIITVALASKVLAQPNFEQFCKDLSKTPRAHPYLIFSAEEKPAILQRVKSDRKLGETMEKILAEGRRYLYATVQPSAPQREIHARYVGVDGYNRYLGSNIQAAVTLAFLYQMTGDERYVAKAFEYADAVCALESWVQSAHHYEVIYSRVWPFNVPDDRVVFTYDITAAGTSQKLAYVYDWLYPALTKAQRDRIRSGLLEKAITRVRGNYDYFWWSSASKCNWSGICYSGLGLAALTLLDEDPQLTDVVARSCQGVLAMIDHIGEDGGWQEGRGYWAYGLGESVMFMEAVRRASSGGIDLFKHRSLSPHPIDFGLYGMTAGFGDGSGAPVGESFVMNKLAQESGDPRAAWYAQKFVRPMETVFDIIWPASTVKPEKPAESSKFFKSIDWAVFRKDFGPEYMTVACKAGMNDDPHHGHLDCGTFNLTWQNLTFVGEIARSSYDEQYFGKLRWDYAEASTEGHNVVRVNGEDQICAKLKDQPWKTGIGGHITQYQSDTDWAYVQMDPTHAYPNQELKSWNRSIVLDKQHNIVVVFDKIGCAIGAEIEVRFHSGVDVEVLKDHVALHGNVSRTEPDARRAARPQAEHRYAPDASGAGGPRGHDLEMVSLVNGDFSMIQGRQPDLPVTEESKFSWVPYFSTLLKAPAQENVIASVFYPAELKNKNAAMFKLESDGKNPVVRCTLDGKTTTYVFTSDHVTRDGQ